MERLPDNILADVVAFWSAIPKSNTPHFAYDDGTMVTDKGCYRMAMSLKVPAVVMLNARQPNSLLHSEDPSFNILHPERLLLVRGRKIYETFPATHDGEAPVVLDLQAFEGLIPGINKSIARENLRENMLHHLLPNVFANHYIAYEEDDNGALVLLTKTTRDYRVPTLSTSSVLKLKDSSLTFWSVLADFERRATDFWEGRDPINLTEDLAIHARRSWQRGASSISRAKTDASGVGGIERLARSLFRAAANIAMGSNPMTDNGITTVSKFGSRPDTDIVPQELLSLIAPHFPRFGRIDTGLRDAIARPDPKALQGLGFQWMDWKQFLPSFIANGEIKIKSRMSESEAFAHWLGTHLRSQRMGLVSYYDKDTTSAIEILQRKSGGTGWVTSSTGLNCIWTRGSEKAYFFYAAPEISSKKRTLAYNADKFFPEGMFVEVNLIDNTMNLIEVDELKLRVPDIAKAYIPNPEKPSSEIVDRLSVSVRSGFNQTPSLPTAIP